MKQLKLKSGADRRIRNGHRWIFSNEVAVELKQFQSGEIVEIVDANNYTLGTGCVNPHALIAVRLFTDRKQTIDAEFFRQTILKASARRHQWYPGETCFRLVYGESDGIPGLVIDQYGTHFVIQSLTAGIDLLVETIAAVLQDVFSPASIVLRQDSSSRRLENLPISRSTIYGALDGPVDATIHGMKYKLDLLEGQKTGFFLDQRENHLLMRQYASGRKVLDCFSFIGAWSLHAARAGATSVLALDSSESSIAASKTHADLNQLSCDFKTTDVFDELKAINDQKGLYDLIILDPPAFAKSKSQVRDAVRGYREINRRAAKALTPGGVLITCSCSHVIDSDTFRNTVLQGIGAAGRSALLLQQGGQAKDHPILMSMRETEYLKCLVMEMVD